eukprot:gene14465-9049_t
MACSVRDRVEVAWQGSFYHATVVRVHSTGKCDVKYDVDASVGTYLTHKQHGLKVLPVLETDDEEVEIAERNDAPCDLPPPPQTDRGDRIPRGVVSPLEFKHKRRGNGSKQRLCLFNNCKSGALKHGLCYRHGAFGVCTSNGCKTNASSDVNQVHAELEDDAANMFAGAICSVVPFAKAATIKRKTCKSDSVAFFHVQWQSILIFSKRHK